jgi:hypothetical protein
MKGIATPMAYIFHIIENLVEPVSHLTHKIEVGGATLQGANDCGDRHAAGAELSETWLLLTTGQCLYP